MALVEGTGEGITSYLLSYLQLLAWRKFIAEQEVWRAVKKGCSHQPVCSGCACGQSEPSVQPGPSSLGSRSSSPAVSCKH